MATSGEAIHKRIALRLVDARTGAQYGSVEYILIFLASFDDDSVIEERGAS